MNLFKKIVSIVLCTIMVLSIVPFGNLEADAASPTVTVNTGSEHYSIGETNAVLCGKVSNPNQAKVSKLGIKLYDASEKLLKDHSESSTFTVTEVFMWFDVNSEIGYTLKKGTTYKYQMYAVVGGTTYTSSMASFTTADPDKAQSAIMPLKKIYVTQKAGGSYSHAGTKNVDFGKSQNLYAPFDCKVVYKDTSYDGGNSIIIESTSKVRFADGTYDYMTVLTAHDNDISDLSKGKTLKQGSVYYHTGTYGNVTGEHVHMCVAKGKYAGQYKNSNGNWELKNSILPSNAFFIDATTTIVDAGGYTWKSLPILSVYYNANGGSISSDTYYLSSGVVYKSSDNSKLCHKWTYNNTQTNGLYDDTTFGIYKTGYTFLGWGTSASGTTCFDKSDNTILPTDLNQNIASGSCSVTLYAIWEEVATQKTCSLVYNANGGTGAPESQTFEENDTIYISTEIPTRFGYVFEGWQTAEGWWYYPGEAVGFFEDTILYAFWGKLDVAVDSSTLLEFDDNNKEYYIEFVPEENGFYIIETVYTNDYLDTIGTLFDSSENVLMNSDDVGDNTNFRISYYLNAGESYFVLAKSYNESHGSSCLTVTPAYEVIFDANGGYGAPDSLNGDYKYQIPFEEPHREGYAFLGWSTNKYQEYPDNYPGDSIEIIGDVKFYAIWEKVFEPYTLFFDANGGSGAPFAHDGDVTYIIPDIIPVREGYTFLGWSESNSASSVSYFVGDEITIAEETTLYAVWQKNQNDDELGDIGNDSDLRIDILTPSTTRINYKDSIILRASITGEIPEGATVVWETSNDNFEMQSIIKNMCGITSRANGNTVITVKIVSEDGEILAQDSQIMTSNAGFFQKIIVFFKEIFGILPKVIPQAFKAAF